MNRSTQTATATIDPVCGMTIDPATAAGSSAYAGETIYFCSRSCKMTFDAAPEKYSMAATPSSCGDMLASPAEIAHCLTALETL